MQVFDGHLQRVFAGIDALGHAQMVADEEIAAGVLAVFFRGGEGVVGHALPGRVENLIAAPQLGMIALGRGLRGEVVHLGIEQRLLIGREFVFLKRREAAVTLDRRAEREVANHKAARFRPGARGLRRRFACFRPRG